uniref:RING-type E3 ubiquitin transferase n=1 Tax=Aceria tosichella TaxID=561515 RepID=A0A6G1S661_9ACAR
MRATLITTGSVLLTTAVIGNAFYHKKQFYPSVVYITKSNPSMAVIYIQCLVMFLLVGKLMRKIFFGTLRAAELEHLIERAWYAVTETCLAFTVYRDDLNARFVGIFAILLFLKCFHWLAEDRVDFMERSPNINILFHVRIVSLLTVLATCDIAFMYFAYHSIITKGAGTQLVFGFEYAILLATILNIVMKYILHWIDLASDSPWDEKAVCLLYTELVMSILKVTLYLVFVAAMLKYHNFPLFALRPIYLSLRTLKKALCDVIMSRRAIRNMNTLYPNATQEELANTDNVCIICREEMTGNGSSKKLPCNHIFHVSCLRSWFQRQQTCPTCRMDILRLPNPATNQTRNNQQAPMQQPAPHMTPAGATGPQAASQANGSQQANTNEAAGNQPQVALHNEVTVVMMHMFAQMFLQALLTNLRVLNQQQLQQQQQQQQPPQQQSNQQDQQSQTAKETVDASTQTDQDPPTTSEEVD